MGMRNAVWSAGPEILFSITSKFEFPGSASDYGISQKRGGGRLGLTYAFPLVRRSGRGLHHK